MNTNTPGEIRVYVTPAASLTWKGDGTTNVWDIATTSNWLNGVNLDKFFQLDHVLFDNSGFTNPAIALTGALWPTSVTVSASQNYTFGGSGSLNGPMTLTKDGSGTLTINNANAYTGATFINGGTLKAGNALALGATNGGTFIGLGGALDIGGQNLGFEAVTAQGDGVGGYGAILNTGAGQINALRRLTLAGDTTIASPVRWDVRGTSTTVIDAVVNGGGFNLTKTSSNELWFVFATISNLADIHVLQGPFGVADCLGLGDPDKNLFVHPGASLYLYSHDAVADAYTKNYFVTNGTVSVSGGVGSSILNGTMTLVGSCSLLNEMTINAPIGGPGSLTRGGGGRLTLNAANSYSGPTTITGGTLALGAGATLGATPLIQINGGTAFDVSALAGGFTLASGQTLAGSGSVTGAVADASGSFIVPGGSNAIGTLTLASNLTLNGGGSLVFDLSTVTNEGGAFNDLLNVRDLTLHGVTTIKLSGAFLNPTSPYTLINYSGALTGAGSLSITSDTRYVLAPDFSVAGKVRVSVIGGGALNLNWVGDWVGSNPRADWDVRLSPYWDTGMSTELFFHGDRVTFGDDGVYSHDVNLATALLPGSLLVNNTYDNYTFLGSGGIASATALVKDGPAALILLTTNTYTGGTLINNGTLQLGNGLVNGSITGNITNNALLAFVPATSNSFAGWITGTGRLLKSGPGTLTLTANNTYSGGTTVEGGELATSGYLYTAQGTGPLLISPGATFRASATHCLTAMTSPITNRGTMLLNGYHRPTSPLYLDGGTFCTIGGFSAGWQGFHFLIPVTTLANAAPSIITNTGVNSGLHIRAATAGGTTFTVEDGSAPQDLIVSATLLNPTDDEPGLGKLIKAGPGLMAFNGTATFSGGIQVNNGTFEINGLIANAANTVTVAGGTLGGTGLVASAVSIQAAGTLAPGASIGTLTISNTLTLAGQTVMEIDRAAAQTSDKVVGLTTVTYGGTLTVTNVGGALAAGDSFKLFDATNYTGDFAAFQLPELASAQTWDTSKLKVDGTLRVAQLLAISGQVALEAFTGPARNGAGSRPVTFVASKVEGAVTTYLATNEVTLTFAAGPDGYGVAGFALVNLPLGVTHLSAKAPLNLRQKLLVFFTGANGTADFTGAYKLPGGDLDGSNFVDIVDYFQLAALWYQLAPAGSPADIDGSGLVDIDDYFILASHWYEAGSPE